MATYELKKSVAKVGEKAVNFGFYKGEDADQILIGPAPTAAVLKEMEKECGKSTRVLKGICFYEGDVLVFATRSAPAPQWKMQLAKVLKERKCQGVSKIDLRQLAPGESDEASDGAGDGSQSAGSLSGDWTTARDSAVAGVSDLLAKLRATGDSDAIKACDIVQQLAAGFPAGMDAAFASVDKAAGSNDAKALATARAQAKAQTEACLGYLKANQNLIGLCEGNPFGANVAISQPLTQALASISSRLA